MLRRCLVVVIAGAVLTTPAAAETSQSSWAQAAITLSTSHGLFPGGAASFEPDATLTAASLSQLVGNLTGNPTTSAANPSSLVTISGLDAALIDALGLAPAAARFQQIAQLAGLDPPARFGTEVVARLLGLRTSHPASQPSLSLQPDQPATMAEAAFSAARILTLAPPANVQSTTSGIGTTSPSPAATAAHGGAVAYVDQLAAGFSLPTLSSWQRQVLTTAVSLIGYPYFAGGDDETLSPGFDCSGFVWRVYKLAVYPSAPQLAATLTGRSAAAMAEEVPQNERITRTELEPGDVLFFGDGPRSTASEISHTAIYLGDDWLIESSTEGVSLGPLSWFGSQFAWAIRPLAEAGLGPPSTPTGTPQAAA